MGEVAGCESTNVPANAETMSSKNNKRLFIECLGLSRHAIREIVESVFIVIFSKRFEFKAAFEELPGVLLDVIPIELRAGPQSAPR